MSEFPWKLLSELRCPYCASSLEASMKLSATSAGMENGTLRCDCYEYPVVTGIAVLRQMGSVASTRNGAVERLREGDVEGALMWLLDAGSAPGVAGPVTPSGNSGPVHSLFRKVREFFRPASGSPPDTRLLQAEGFEAALKAMRPGGYASYLFHRFANPSFLGAIPPLIVLGDVCRRGPRRRLLDLMCGTGHSSATVRALCPEVEVIMADVDFVNLFIARNFLARDAVAVCLDVEIPLPFLDDSIDALFCLDGLHYARSKVALLEEVDRIVSPDGAWLFAHMHNARGANVNPGAPLDAQGYLRRFAFGEQRLLPETEVLRQFKDDGCLDLTHQPPAAVLDSSDALTLVGARTKRLWTRHSGLDDALSRRPDRLAFNPLYRLEKATDGLVARAAWPSESLRTECAGAKPLLRETVHLRSLAAGRFAAARAGEKLSDEVRALIRSFVLVSLPECYPRAELAAR
jgi:SAM-dependent methyltransferase